MRSSSCSTVAVTALLVGACSGGSVDASRVATRPTSVVSAPIATATASALADATVTPEVSAPPPVETRPLVAPPGVNADDFALLSSLCSLATWEGPTGTQVGCRTNPPFDQPDERPDGLLSVAADFNQLCILQSVTRGSFSGAGKEEAMVALSACNEEWWNDISPGHVVLAEKVDGAWRTTAVQQGTNVDKCKVAPGAKGDLLVCADNVGAFGDGSLTWRFTLDFSKPAGERIKVFGKVYRSANVSCTMGIDFIQERGATHFSVVSETLKDLDGDGDLDLEVVAKRAHVDGNDQVVKRVEKICDDVEKRGEGSFFDETVLTGKPTQFTLQWKRNGDDFVPTPATAKLLTAWREGAPSFWWNVIAPDAPP